MKVLVPGILGFVGRAVLTHLLECGHEVFGVVRSVSEKAQLPPTQGVSLFVGDVTKPQDLIQSLPQFDACIYLPGLLREYPSKGIRFKSVHATGVQNLIKVAKQKGARRWIQMSALGVGRGYNTGYYNSKERGETFVRTSDLEWTIFRPSVVFSDKPNPRLHFISELANVIGKAPVIPIFGDGEYRLQPVSLDVLAKAMVDALTMPETIGMIYEVGGPEKLTYKQILRMIAEGMGKTSKPSISIPFGPVRFFASVLDRFSFFPITRDQLTMLECENIVENDEADIAFEKIFHPQTVKFKDGVQNFFSTKPRN